MTQPDNTHSPSAQQAAAALRDMANTPGTAQPFLPNFPTHRVATALRPEDPAQLSLLLSTAERVIDTAVAQAWLTIATTPTGSEELDDLYAYVAHRASATAAKAARNTLMNCIAGTALIRPPMAISPELILPATAAAIREARRTLTAALQDSTASITGALAEAPHLAQDPAGGTQVLTDLAEATVAAIASDFNLVLELLKTEPRDSAASQQERLAAD